LTVLWITLGFSSYAEEAVVYSVYKGIDMGDGKEAQRDLFLNVGTNQGVKVGQTLEVARRQATYDLAMNKLYKDVIYPFAKIRIIHSEKDASIARVEKYLPSDQTPVLNPPQVMVGDLVRPR
jgi:hypothetical protein